MRKRNTPIRMITVRPVQARQRMVLALAKRLGIGSSARRSLPAPSLALAEGGPESLELDQRVRELGEW